MNNLRQRGRGLGRFGAVALAALSLVVACRTDTIADDSTGGAGSSAGDMTHGSAGMAQSSAGMAHSSAGATQAGAGSAGATMTGQAGDANGGDDEIGGNSAIAGSASGGAAPIAGSGGLGGGGGASGPACGNGKVDPGEECDDGNTKSGDGCSAACTTQCEKCEKAYCIDQSDLTEVMHDCFGPSHFTDPMGANAQGGPAAGTPKTELCQALVECARRTHCAEANFGAPVQACFCGNADAADCKDPAKGPLGACADEVAAAAESRDFSVVQQRYHITNFAVGMAETVLSDCDASACADACYAGKEATACVTCALGSDPTGFSSFTCPSNSCYFDDDQRACAAMGTCIAPLCAPAADCAIQSGCAANGVVACYDNGHGPCAAQIAAAAGATDPIMVNARLATPDAPPLLVLSQLLTCEAQNCQSACFPNAAGASSGGASSAGASSGGASSAGASSGGASSGGASSAGASSAGASSGGASSAGASSGEASPAGSGG